MESDYREIIQALRIISSIVVVLGLPFAIWKFLEEGRRQRQIMADGLYQKYLEFAFANPKLSWPGKSIPTDERYPWLVAMLLNAHAAQIKSNPSPDMLETIRADLSLHYNYLSGDDFRQEGGWSLYPKELEAVFSRMKRSLQSSE